MRHFRRPFPAFAGLLLALAGRGAAQPAPSPFRWEGLARRNPGLVLKSRWDGGVLELKDDLVRWTDRKDPGKNLVLPVQRITSHALKCPAGPAASCTQWRISTRTETYVFREEPSAGGATLRRAFDALRGAYADVPSSEGR
ncbi:MAG TPA: hypothetical protein VMN04_11850 [Thermoanaerobaculia bacterium]|nr:hypothetical protein [Thermoanaerobaculia bacterium]